MPEPITRVTLLVPGPPALKKVALEGKLTAEWIDNDGHFGEAFSFGTVAPAAVKKIDAAKGALIVHATVDLRDGRKEIVKAVKKLESAGALAVRLEQSKLGWTIDRWLETFSAEDPWAWHRGAVAFLTGEKFIQSCGMHAFSLPDVHLPLDGTDPAALQELGTVLDVYQLAEDPVIRSGETFSPSPEEPRRRLERWPDTEYPPGHACHNPYGVWRFGAAGSKARPLGELVPNFMPALRVILAAAEAKSEKPLTKKQVESLRDECPCIAMKPRDVQQLERARGYADLDPELAWEQWQLLRKKV